MFTSLYREYLVLMVRKEVLATGDHPLVIKLILINFNNLCRDGLVMLAVMELWDPPGTG